MDPNANLKEQLELANKILEEDWSWSDVKQLRNAERLAKLVLEMDEWLSAMGELPSPWIG